MSRRWRFYWRGRVTCGGRGGRGGERRGEGGGGRGGPRLCNAAECAVFQLRQTRCSPSSAALHSELPLPATQHLTSCAHPHILLCLPPPPLSQPPLSPTFIPHLPYPPPVSYPVYSVPAASAETPHSSGCPPLPPPPHAQPPPQVGHRGRASVLRGRLDRKLRARCNYPPGCGRGEEVSGKINRKSRGLNGVQTTKLYCARLKMQRRRRVAGVAPNANERSAAADLTRPQVHQGARGSKKKPIGVTFRMEIKRTRAAAECAAVDERAAARGLLRLETRRRGRGEEGGDCAHGTNSCD